MALSEYVRIVHTGGINGFRTGMSHYPESDLDIVILSNTSSPVPGQMERAIAGWVLGVSGGGDR